MSSVAVGVTVLVAVTVNDGVLVMVAEAVSVGDAVAALSGVLVTVGDGAPGTALAAIVGVGAGHQHRAGGTGAGVSVGKTVSPGIAVGGSITVAVLATAVLEAVATGIGA